MAITFDDQLEALDRHIVRQRKFVTEKRNSYSSHFLAVVQREIEVFEAARETVRQARQNQQMTTMSGKRIEDT